jgi:large subunit ribosomal protein L4
MEVKVYNQEGKESGKVKLPESVFGLPWNADLVHQVVVSMRSNARTPVAHTKGRADVRGGGKKPWKQKGTGRARHGSTRSPIWRGGGVTFGPTNEKDYAKKVNKKMRKKALLTVLSRKFKEGEILFIDNLNTSEPKTKDAKLILQSLGKIDGFTELGTRNKNSAYVALGKKDVATEKSFRNFGNIEVDEVRNLNANDLLNFKYVVISEPKAAIAFLEKQPASKSEESKKEKVEVKK